MSMLASTLLWVVSTYGTGSVPPESPPLADYFRIETAKIASRPLLGIESATAWKSRRPELQAKLKDMLGLIPEPPRGDLHVEIRGTTERPDFVVERILFQSLPGLYVTGNIYRPRKIDGRLPAILYVCGHSKVEKDGVILGNKTHYQHHAAWYAANGYICLILDTLELGEVPGVHHGTYSKGRWWWLARGYTPAGVEAWNGLRGIDYLISRPDVDASKIGVTGRSGGGATSWWIGAIDDRVAAVCPVAGITDLTNHVVDGVVEGHCDCMYFANTERWDYTMLAALVAPKPLFVENTDKDPIFPENGVRRIYTQLEKIYGWYDAKDRLSLLIGKGGHADTEELRHASFAFFEKYLKGNEQSKIVEPDRNSPIESLKVLSPGERPSGSRNDSIDESFVPSAGTPVVPQTTETWCQQKASWIASLKERTIAGWPKEQDVVPLNLRLVKELTQDQTHMRVYEFTSQTGVVLEAYHVSRLDGAKPTSLQVEVLDDARFEELRPVFEAFSSQAGLSNSRRIQSFKHLGIITEIRLGSTGEETQVVPVIAGDGEASLFVSVRGIGRTKWPANKDVQIRRRFMLLGQTLEGMRAYDIHRSLMVAGEINRKENTKEIRLKSYGTMCGATLLAAILEQNLTKVTLSHPPRSFSDGPALWLISRTLDMPQLAAILYPTPLTILDDPGSWRWAEQLAQKLDPDRKWPFFLKAEPR